eukprot:CAMPEP_0169305376 /NCGR_PEP_ID=MMETSP1017-20121227/93_1 /TAXON_ID=342587 /ORGANISM="Karlodinium micrum, Strain CCMP2283" /LENGTH=130 /DNA_ID=CAMNT_0009398327 /DNA_START=465 /DNA_END=857 /DNA_ORIENTATION=-
MAPTTASTPSSVARASLLASARVPAIAANAAAIATRSRDSPSSSESLLLPLRVSWPELLATFGGKTFTSSFDSSSSESEAVGGGISKELLAASSSFVSLIANFSPPGRCESNVATAEALANEVRVAKSLP